MSSRAKALLEEIRRSGGAVSVREDGSLLLRGEVPESLVDRLRESKPDVVALLRGGGSSLPSAEAMGERMRHLAPKLGRLVKVGEPWGSGTLWGITPRGAIVNVGRVLVTFDFEEVA